MELKKQKIETIKVGSSARDEMTREKARVMGRKKFNTSDLEKAAERWRQEKERQERERRRICVDRGDDVFPESTSLETIVEKKESGLRSDQGIGETGWKQYNKTIEKQDEKAGQDKRVNTASIWVYARRIMAREWARALGKNLSRESQVEIEAREYKRRKEEEETRKIADKEARERARQEEILRKKRLREEMRLEREIKRERKLYGCAWTDKNKWDEKTLDWVKRKIVGKKSLSI